MWTTERFESSNLRTGSRCVDAVWCLIARRSRITPIAADATPRGQADGRSEEGVLSTTSCDDGDLLVSVAGVETVTPVTHTNPNLSMIWSSRPPQ
jgi:hypothetical protein